MSEFVQGVVVGATVTAGAFSGFAAAVAWFGAARQKRPVVGRGFAGDAPPGEFDDGRLVKRARPDPFRGPDDFDVDRSGKIVSPADRAGRPERSQWD